jgi:uncharacterized phage protein gp47/JayE
MSADSVVKKDFATLVSDMLGELRQPGLGRTPLTDANEGSVVRTLVETYARELALGYEQLERVYRMGYLDTASGQALDLVVALLGVERRPVGWLAGMVTFRRVSPAPADIPIPTGTLIGGKGAPLCETARSAVLPAGATQVTVEVRSVEVPEPKIDQLDAGKLTFMPRVINGIDGVTNEHDLVLSKKPESDDELRERVRHAVDGSNLGTLEALRVALARHGVSEVKLEEPPDLPGVVRVRVEGLAAGDDDKRKELQDALDRARPAGVQVRLEGTSSLLVGLTATLVLDRERSEVEKQRIQAKILADLQTYFASLKIGDPVLGSKVANLLGADAAVTKVESGALVVNGNPVKDPDVVPLLSERAKVDLDQVKLRFVPAALLVQVDARVITAQPLGAPQQDKLRTELSDALDKVPPGQSFTLGSIVGQLSTSLPQDARLKLTLTHRHSGLVVELSAAPESDTRADREQLKLGNLEVAAS